MNDSLVVGATAFVLAVLLTCVGWVLVLRSGDPPEVPPTAAKQIDDPAPQRLVLDVREVERIAEAAARRAVEDERARQSEQVQPRLLKASLCADLGLSPRGRAILHCEELER